MKRKVETYLEEIVADTFRDRDTCAVQKNLCNFRVEVSVEVLLLLQKRISICDAILYPIGEWQTNICVYHR